MRQKHGPFQRVNSDILAGELHVRILQAALDLRDTRGALSAACVQLTGPIWSPSFPHLTSGKGQPATIPTSTGAGATWATESLVGEVHLLSRQGRPHWLHR